MSPSRWPTLTPCSAALNSFVSVISAWFDPELDGLLAEADREPAATGG